MTAAATLLTVVLAAPIQAQDVDALAICYEEWPPFGFTGKDGEPTGASIEVVREALTRADIAVSFMELPYPRCVRSVETGEFDAILMTSDEGDLLQSDIPVTYWEIGVVVQDSSPLQRIATLEDLSGRTVGMVSSYWYPEAIDGFSGWTRVDAVDATFNLRKVAAGRLDATIIDVPWAMSVAETEALPVRALQPRLVVLPQGTLFNTDGTEEFTAYEAALTAFIGTAEADEIYRRFTGQSLSDTAASAGQALLTE